jgi:hypothetical protein
MSEPILVVPVNFSPVGDSVPEGETVHYSTLAKVKLRGRSPVGAAIASTQTGGILGGEVHMVLTDKNILMATLKHEEKHGVQTIPLTRINRVKKGSLFLVDAAIALKHDPKNTSEDKVAFKARVAQFPKAVLPLVIAETKLQIESGQAAGQKGLGMKMIQGKLKAFENQLSKLK